ncbi:MAG TPA: EVE domain-containing protein [Acetobacteraceae bacterium]|nr:EVE domain-containing protein [Acetobacteraceae bacterium]
MRYWLVKSEPDAFGWREQVAHGTEPWTGVRNHAAKRNLMAMRRGDRAFFYHSNVGKEIVGVVEVVREAYPDPTAKEEARKGAKGGAKGGEWVAVDVKAVGPMKRPVTLAAIKEDPAFADFLLVRQARLSVMPVSEEHWHRICELGGFHG